MKHKDKIKHFLGEFAVRIDNADSVPVLNILNDHIFKKGCFSHACFPDDIDMLAPVMPLYAKALPMVPEVRFCKIYFVAIVIHTTMILICE